jgi:hypothetical protein
MIQEVDKPGSEISVYIEKLGEVLDQHVTEIDDLYSRLQGFRHKLQEEQRLSKICLAQSEAVEFKENQHYFADDEAGDEPRGRMNKVQSSYEYPVSRGSNYKA